MNAVSDPAALAPDAEANQTNDLAAAMCATAITLSV